MIKDIYINMPNKNAKNKKRTKRLLTAKWNVEGRTAKQHNKWLAKQKEKNVGIPTYGRR